MLIVIGVVTGLLAGVWGALLWGLRKAKGVWPELFVVGLALCAIAFSWGGELFGWPTPGSIAVSTGAATGPVDQWLLVGIEVVTVGVVLAVLVRSGVTRRLERWSSASE